MGTILLIFVICLMIGFILLAFFQKSKDSEDELPILTLDEVKQFKNDKKEESQ